MLNTLYALLRFRIDHLYLHLRLQVCHTELRVWGLLTNSLQDLKLVAWVGGAIVHSVDMGVNRGPLIILELYYAWGLVRRTRWGSRHIFASLASNINWVSNDHSTWVACYHLSILLTLSNTTATTRSLLRLSETEGSYRWLMHPNGHPRLAHFLGSYGCLHNCEMLLLLW